MVSTFVAAAAAYVVGAFTPAVGRKIKALFVTDSEKAIKEVNAFAAKEAAVVEKKLL